MNLSHSETEFDEEQKVDKVLLALFYLVSAVIGYGIIHYLHF
jgi:hypothetical protein